ncbi:RDD family protein [Streptomyces sp. NPDC048416]|uniref:RDD family protein n=1 Tax=Streptomyces sp. NPDC048416 TaxID=3365546 RepID=UPI0037165DE8
MSALVTGDAVVLGLRPARLPSRALALLIDLAVVWAAYILISMVMLLATASLDSAAQAAITVALFLLVLVGAPIAVETLTHGRSLGKLACGLRVVRDDGGPIRFRHALVRGAMAVIEILLTFGVVGCIASLVSARGRRIGDVFAGTLVVRERVPSGRTAAVPPPPPWLVGRFATLDLSRVPDELWLAVRQYLTRMQQLDPQVSWALAVRLADDMASRTGAPCPQGTPPAAYLAGVVSERQARDARRAFAGGAAVGAHSAPVWGPGVGVGPRAGSGTGPGSFTGAGSGPGWGAGTAPGGMAPGGAVPVGTVPVTGSGFGPAARVMTSPGAVAGAGVPPVGLPVSDGADATAGAGEGAGQGTGEAGVPARPTGFAPPA